MSDEAIDVKASREPGVCFACRHANQNTEDYEKEYVFCQFQPGKREWKSPCDMTLTLEDGKTAYLYEPFDGKNGTWGSGNPNLRVIVDE
ncbi:MAG: hypothetical protein IT381_21375 [Deltaproteobacteria bacterium]|nr:hypothetical protein [Deltaproteobacteria bacterium]